MFFLPLFGAAVQGRSHNAPGWQRAVVALAGPIPGIIVGCAILYLFHDQRILAVIGLATIFLNALNLLPFLPLDGGWVVQTTLFSRNQYLDFLFRVAAVVGLGAIGFWFGAKIIIGLAVLMGFGLPYQWRVGKLTHQLKREGLKPEPSSHDELCEPTVFEIVQRLRTDTNISTPMRSAAAFSIYELLSAKPPGILASLALLFTQATGFFGSIIFALWVMQLAWFGPGNPQGPMFPSVPEPEVELASAESVAPSPNVKLDQQTPETIYVNCATSKRMQQAWQALSNETGVVVSRFGQTIVIELLKDDPKLSEEMMVIARALDAGAFVSEHNLKVGVEIGFEADSPDEAQRITAQLDQYFFATEFEIAPPWLKGLDLNPGFQQARLTLHEIQQIDLDIETDEELDELISSAYEKREQQEILKALQKLQEQQKQQRTIAIRQYLAANANADQRVVAQWLEMNNGVALSANLPESAEEMEARHSQRLDAMAKLLGPLPETLEENRRFDYSILSGYSVVEGNYVRVHQLQCYRPTTAIQAITAWLEKEGASKIRYSLYDTHALFESMIEE